MSNTQSDIDEDLFAEAIEEIKNTYLDGGVRPVVMSAAELIAIRYLGAQRQSDLRKISHHFAIHIKDLEKALESKDFGEAQQELKTTLDKLSESTQFKKKMTELESKEQDNE